jgi:hypothetical protein
VGDRDKGHVMVPAAEATAFEVVQPQGALLHLLWLSGSRSDCRHDHSPRLSARRLLSLRRLLLPARRHSPCGALVDLRDEFIEKDEALGLFVVLLQLRSLAASDS